MWDLIVSVPDHCLSFYFTYENMLSYVQTYVAYENMLFLVKIDVTYANIICPN